MIIRLTALILLAIFFLACAKPSPHEYGISTFSDYCDYEVTTTCKYQCNEWTLFINDKLTIFPTESACLAAQK